MPRPQQASPREPRGANTPSKSKPKVLDRASIEAKALAYLDRFDASATRLRRVLGDFVKRRSTALAVEPTPFLGMVAELIARYEANGLIDDRRFGTALATRLSERGASRQAIRMKLKGRGLSGELAVDVTQALDAGGHTELDAARTLVRKRKLGNYRAEDERRLNVRRDLGVLARAGFDFDVAKRALAVEGADDEEF